MGFRPSQVLKRSVRWWHWVRTQLKRFDVVFIDREIFDDTSTDMEQRFRESCRRLVIDLDDAVFLRYPDKFETLMRLADLVVCGNRFLMEKVTPLNANVCHVPTCVDMGDYHEKSCSAAVSPPVIGWMGTTGNMKYISVAAEALRQLAGEVRYEFRVIVPDASGLSATDLSGVRVVHELWQPGNEVDQLSQLDIGIMPLLPDQEWDLYKCGLKLIQYLAVGIPGVATPVGVNSEILDNDRNGFSARTTEEWVYGLRSLIANPELRHQMGKRGRRTVEQKYSIQANYPVLRNAIRSIIE
jgi:glycosyltransferase involved in cell wall biosynthesis